MGQPAAELEVLPNAELKVVNTGCVDDDDLAGLVGGGGARSGGTEVERGFAGTALTGVGIAG